MTHPESEPISGPDPLPERGVDSAGADVTLAVVGTLIDGVESDVLVAGNRIWAIEPHDPARTMGDDVVVLDGARTAALPGLLNGHTHTAMAMLRGFADDMPLMPWLEHRIWPFEARLTEDDVYWGARLGCLEMIRTGTTFFNDMYWHFRATAKAVRDSGMRAVLAGTFIDMGNVDECRRQMDVNAELMESVSLYGDRVGFALGPHALYTVSELGLRWVADESSRQGVPIHMHLSETQGEVDSCVEAHGARPVEYADRMGLLSSRLLAAHAVHLTDDEIEVLAERGVHVLHNPVSNLKLASGGPMRYADLSGAGVNVLLATDGAASNNNLDLFEEMKFASLMAKHASGDPTTMPAAEAMTLATLNPARAFGLDAGSLAPGRLADLLLIDLDNPFLFPGHNLISDLVYSANGRAVKTTICDGRVLMENGVIEGEDEVRREVSERLDCLTA